MVLSFSVIHHWHPSAIKTTGNKFALTHIDPLCKRAAQRCSKCNQNAMSTIMRDLNISYTGGTYARPHMRWHGICNKELGRVSVSLLAKAGSVTKTLPALTLALAPPHCRPTMLSLPNISWQKKSE